MAKPFPDLAVRNRQLHALLGDIVNIPLSGRCGHATFRPIRGVIEAPAMGRSGHIDDNSAEPRTEVWPDRETRAGRPAASDG
jgi:hypothetical protein